MKEYLELGKNGQLRLSPSICREVRIQESDLLKVVIKEDGSIHHISLTKEERNLVEQSQIKDIKWAKDSHDHH